MMIALVVAELGTRIPLAGYAYQWSARLVNPTYGWFVGFAGLLYMAVGGGAIMLGVASPLLLSEFNVDHPSARLVLAVAIILSLLPVVINIISIQVAARVNNIAVFTEIAGTVVFGVLLFVLWGVHAKPDPYGASILTSTTSTLHNPTWYAFALAGLLGAFTLVGFELAADMSEDAVNPVRSVPRGVLWAVGGSAVLGMVALIGFTIAIPSLKAVESSSLPLLTIAGYWLPSWLVKVFVAFVVFSMFAILVVGSGAQARLVYSLARDNMLPFSRILRKVNARSQTPIIALLVLAVIDTGVMIYGYLQTSAFDTLVGATAIIPYIIYFLITLAYAIKRRAADSIPGAFSLGRWAWPVIGFVLAYTALIMIVLSFPAPFHGADKVLGYGLALAALWYFGGLLWRLRRGTAGVKPVEDLVER
jgi:amino acid transporter